MKSALIVSEQVPNTGVLEAPPGQEGECSPLAFVRCGNFFVTRWELSEDERKQIAAGGSVFLMVMGSAHPPVALATRLSL